jgi:hypothetical protein
MGLPRPWGVTALFAEYTGAHPPLEVDWSLERGGRISPTTPIVAARPSSPPPPEPEPAEPSVSAAELEFDPESEPELEPEATRVSEPAPFATFWEFAVALNRSDPAALALAANGASAGVPIDPTELRRLLGTMWFRSALSRLSRHWRDRMLETLIAGDAVPDHTVRVGRKTMRLRDLSYEQLQEIRAQTIVPDDVQSDLDLLITIGRHWGADAVRRFQFVSAPERGAPSMLESLLDKVRSPWG